jgi:hypothetical protein
MANFREKSIFVWNNHVIEGGDPARIIARLREAGFEGAYLHSTHTTNWKSSSRIALARALKAAGFAVYASVAVYAKATAAAVEGQQSAGIVNEYGLDGCVFDVESGEYETPGAEARVRALLSAYKANTAKPAAFCGWPFYHASNNPNRIYHPVGVLVEAMKIADYAMPMAYPSGDNNTPAALTYLDAVWRQWRTYTAKPLVIAGRACNDNAGQANAASIVPYALRARELGAVGMSWWDMEHALPLPGVWDALAETPPISGNAGEPEPPGKDDPVTEKENPHKTNALGYLAKSVTDPGWANTGFEFFVGYGCKLDGVEKPNDDLAPMERKAAELGKPFVIALDFTVKYYTGQQYGLDESKWPAFNMDYPLQRFASIAANRQYQEIWINFTDALNHAGKPAGAPTLDFTLKTFLKKALEWAKANRPDLKLRVFTNWKFMDTEVADGPQWIHNHDTGVKQPALTPLDESYPQKDDKPGWLGAKPGGPFWWYTDRLVMFDGDAAELRAALKFGGTTPPPPPPPDDDDPPPGDFVKTSDFATYQEQVAAQLAQMEARHAADIAALLAKIPTGLKYD